MHPRISSKRSVIGAVFVPLLIWPTAPLHAQDDDQSLSVQEETGEIIVTGKRLRGSVVTTVLPLEEIDEADIQSLGASSISEVIEAVSPQTNSGRGRSGRPIFLLNGQRISSFRELRDLPPEAIRRVQVFPEEVALQYGFRPNQRVINFILKENFASAAIEIEHGQPQSGGYGSQEYEATFTRIGKNYRLNIDLEYENSTALTEDERDIAISDDFLFAVSGNINAPTSGDEIDPALSALAGQTVTAIGIPNLSNPTLANFAANNGLASDSNIGAFRTLIAAEDRFELNATYSQSLAPQTTISVNANYELDDTRSLLGLPSASLTLPSTSPFSPFTDDVVINQYFNAPRALTRDSETQTMNIGSAFNTLLGPWRWTLTGDFNYLDNEQRTNRNADFTALQAGLNDGSINPFADDFGDQLTFLAPDTSNSTSQTLEIRNTFSGELLRIPSGPIRLTLGQNYNQQWLDTQSIVSEVSAEASLRRRTIAGTANLEVPIVERDFGALGFLGELSINGNYGLSDLSDFGTLTQYGFGLTWSPSPSLTLQASFISEEAAPDISSLGAPNIVTPNSSFFDLSNNETVFIDTISGGNPNLRSEKRNDIKLAVTWKPEFLRGATIQSEFFRNKSSDITSSFPLLTPEIEAAFPDRVVRDINGQLLSVDQRAITYDEFKSKSIRSGISYRGTLGKKPVRPTSPPGGAKRANGEGSGKPAGGAAPRGHSRWGMSLFHTWRFQEEILISPGTPILDRLDGSSTNFFGGTPEHEIELSAGIFHNGMGMRLNGEYRSGTHVDGSGLASSTDLKFSDRFSLSGRFFISFDQRGDLTKKIPFLKGSRIRLRVQNILNDYIRVTDSTGLQPLNYQRGYVDPTGRYFELNFRKRF